MRFQRLLPIAVALAPMLASAGDGFDSKLGPEERIQHALSRLTFGARPGDAAEVRRLGLEKWIDLQLHPERIAESPILETRLKPLETLTMQDSAIYKEYYLRAQQEMMMMNTMNRANPREVLGGDNYRKLFEGNIEDRRSVLMALAPEKRAQILPVISPGLIADFPEFKKEREDALKRQNEDRQSAIRRLHPPLTELLDRPNVEIALRGTPEQRTALFASLDAGKREKVAAALPPNALAGEPLLRRLGSMSRSPRDVPASDLREAKLYRAIYSNRQLEEILTDFWFNHFNVYDNKGQQGRTVLTSYERDAIRPHVLGKFKDLLAAVAHHPAMLYYLDNWESMVPGGLEIGPFAPNPMQVGPTFFSRLAHGINENYGRELLELHTLGVDGGYTQQDVINVARCFTGWTIRQPVAQPEFVFASFMHDQGEKIVLGHKIPAGGNESDGLQVLDILAHHPSTARFISTKLARRFVADVPPPALIDRMARTFLKTDGDLRAVLQTMFSSPEFFSEGALQAKVKSPLELVASAVRAIGADALDTLQLVQKVAEMGEPLYGKETPQGYKDVADAWLSTANIIARMRFAETLANGKIPGVKVDLSRFDGKPAEQVLRELLGRAPSPKILAAIEEGMKKEEARTGVIYCPGCLQPNLIAAAVLSAPEFQRR